MKKENKKKKGFTLIELLATIFIISLILGISGSYIISTINTSKEKSEKLAIANIKTTARIYIEENPNDVLWQIDEENTEKSYSCISIDTLINKGLLKKELKETYPTVKYVIVTKDNNNNFLSEKIDNTNTCSKNSNTVKIPTSTKYCNDLTYDSTTENQKLTKTPTDHFQFYDDLKKDAGTYKVTAKLEEGYIWQDGTKEDKTITCTIKKAFPMLVLDPNGEDNTNIEIGKDLTTKLTSNVDGKITIKPTNKNYATAKTSDNNPNITATTPKEITITPLATRKINTTITITLTPTDTNNYYSSSINYTIGSPEKTKVPIPTSDTYCKQNLTYNKTSLTLVEKAATGFSFYNTTGIEPGTYEVIAQLKYGYIWSDNTTTNKIINCTINEATSIVTFKEEGGSSCTPNTKTVTYNKPYGDLCNTSKTNYQFLGWYTEETNGTKITEDTVVTKLENHTLYAHWKEYHYLVDNQIYTTTFQEAINVASNNSTIKLVNNYEDTIKATVDKNITFDTNGQTWTRTEMTTINSGNTLTITGSGTMIKKLNSNITSGSDSLFYNNGTLTINYDGTIKYETTVDTTSDPVMHVSIDNNGTLSISKGTFINIKTRNLSNNSNATTTITGGEITTNGGRAINNNNGKITVENVTINTTNARGINNEGNGTITIKETTIKTTDARAIQNDSTGTITINSGTFDTEKINIESRVIVNASSGSININGGKITGTNERPIQNENSGTININGGTISSSNSNTIYNNSNGTINISGGTFNSSSAQVIYNNSNGTINMTNGTITATGTGIYNNKGTVTISNGSITTTSARIIQNDGSGSIKITGGTFNSSNARGIQNESNGSITIEGGNITSSEAITLINHSSGTITVKNGTITSQNARAVQNNTSGKININGGTITSNEGSTIYNVAGGTIEITNGYLTANKSSKPVCVYNYGTGTIYIRGGTMRAIGTSAKAYYNKSTGSISVSGGNFYP